MFPQFGSNYNSGGGVSEWRGRDAAGIEMTQNGFIQRLQARRMVVKLRMLRFQRPS